MSDLEAIKEFAAENRRLICRLVANQNRIDNLLRKLKNEERKQKRRIPGDNA